MSVLTIGIKNIGQCAFVNGQQQSFQLTKRVRGGMPLPDGRLQDQG